jgi:hypothetical protein
MEFKARVFIPKKISYWKRNTLSEKISDLSALFFIIIALIYYLFLKDKNDDFKLNTFFGIAMLLPVLGLLISPFIRFNEYEIAKGNLVYSISFEEDGIQILEKMYLFSEIQNLHISYGNIVGDSTSSRYGPAYSIGIDNYIEFKYKNKKNTTYFQIQSRSQYVAIQADLFYYVINEIFPFEKKNLNFIDKKYHHHTLYKEFIEKMKREGKLT